MMILMTQGGWGVQNWPKVDDVIYECSLSKDIKNIYELMEEKEDYVKRRLA